MRFLILFLAVIILVFSVRRGYRRGITREIKLFIDLLVAILCLVLILLLKRAIGDHTYATVIVVAGALVILGIGWRFIKLISSPLSGFKELGFVRVIDSFLGGIIGLAEGTAAVWIILFVLEKMNIIETGLLGILGI